MRLKESRGRGSDRFVDRPGSVLATCSTTAVPEPDEDLSILDRIKKKHAGDSVTLVRDRSFCPSTGAPYYMVLAGF